MDINIPVFSKGCVLVVGDVMLDRYWQGPVSRISPEAPVPVVHVSQRDTYPGGAGNVAMNLAALGVKTRVLGLTGIDESADILEHHLKAAGAEVYFDRIEEIPTITKLRVLSQHQQLLRMDFEAKISQELAGRMVRLFQDCLDGVDVVILSDYGKGTLSCALELIKIAKAQNIPVLVDPKKIDFSGYAGATMITPNFKEFVATVGECINEHQIITKGRELIAKHDLDSLLITRGENGMTLLTKDKEPTHVPTHAQEVFDVTGAGDTVIATLAAGIACGADFSSAVRLANIAAGIVVAKLGSATVSVPELHRAVRSSQSGCVVNHEQLKIIVSDMRAKGETVVMTNGCFDILHAGHIKYLKQAKALGDHLIIAVNDDDSIRRLKGADRPINSLERRMAVLGGLSVVDWIVPFGEDTPADLINDILPDVLVKGGDYEVADIAGSECVLKNGGTVKILDFVKNCSTSAIIEKMNNNYEENFG